MIICNGAEYALDEHNRRVSGEDRQCWHGSPTPVTAESTRLSFKVLTPVFMTVFVGIVWLMLIRPFVAKIANDLDVSVPLVGQIITAGMLTVAVAGLFAGPLADHYGHRRSIVVGLGFMALSCLMMGLSPSFPLLIVGALIGGLGAAMTYGVAFAVVTNRYVDDTRRKALGLTQAAGTSAQIFSAPVLTAVAAVALWRGAFVFAAVVIVVALGIVLRLLPADRRTPDHRITMSEILRAYLPITHSRTMVALYGASLLRAAMYLGMAIYLSALYVERFGFSVQEVGIATMLEGTGLVVGNLLAGGRLGRYNQRTVFAISSIGLGIGWVLVFTFQISALSTVMLAMLIGFAGGVSFTNLATLLAQNTPAGAATTMVLNISSIGAGASVGAAFGGMIILLGGYSALGIGFLPFAITATLLVWRPARLGQLVPRLASH